MGDLGGGLEGVSDMWILSRLMVKSMEFQIVNRIYHFSTILMYNSFSTIFINTNLPEESILLSLISTEHH